MGMTGMHNQKKVAINSVKMEIMDYSVIPSTMTILRLDSITPEEQQWMQDNYPNLLEGVKLLDKSQIFDLKTLQEQEEKEKAMEDCDRFVKEVLPKIEFVEPEYPQGIDKDRVSLRVTDFKQSYDYTRTAFGQIFSYYALLERIFKFEFSFTKITSNLQEALALEDAINLGLPFWGIDPEITLQKRRQMDQAASASQVGSSKSGAQ